MSVLHKKRLLVKKLAAYILNGGDGKIRTPDQLVRSQLLYPTELHPHLDLLFSRIAALLEKRQTLAYVRYASTLSFFRALHYMKLSKS